MKYLIIIIATTLITASSAIASSREVLVTIGKDSASKLWAKETCEFLHESITNSSEGNISTNCVWLKNNEMTNESVRKESRSGKYLFQLDLRENDQGVRNLRAINLQREDETDFTQVAWTIEKNANSDIAIHKLIKNLFKMDLYRDEVKIFFLTKGIQDSELVAMNSQGQFIETSFNSPISPKVAYKTFMNESPKNKNFLRATIEIAAALGLGAFDYYNKKEINARDWDFPTVRESIDSKLNGKAYRFDDNSLKTNTGHAYAGTAYYMLARSNGFTSMESFLFTFAASSTWEFVAEFREVVSVNDQIITPLGGFAIGEGFHQIAKIFSRKGNTIVDKTLGTIFDPATGLHDWVDKRYSSKKDISLTGFSNDFWSRFDIELALVKNGNNAKTITGGFDAEIINIAEYEKAGKKNQIISDTAFTRMMLSVPQNSEVGEELKFVIKNALAAYYKKDKAESDAKGSFTGYSFLIGPSNGFEFNSKDRSSKNADFMTVVNVLGGTMDLVLYTNGIKIRTTLDIFGDFAIIRSYTINSYKSQHDIEFLTSVLAENNLYYAKGVTSALNLSIEKGRISFGAKYDNKHFSSINGHYRDQEKVVNDIQLKDKKSELEIWIAYQISKNVKTKLSYATTKRGGEIKDFGIFETTEKRLKGTLIYNFR